MAALALFGALIITLSLVMSIYAIIRIEVHLHTQEHTEMVKVPAAQLYTSTKDIFRDPEPEDATERLVTPEDVYAGDFEFREIP